MRRSEIIGFVFVLAIGASGCRDRRFSDRSAAVLHLKTNQEAFEQIAEAWVSGVSNDYARPPVFCNFDGSTSFRWATIFFRKTEHGFRIKLNGKERDVSSLEEAAQLASVPYPALKHWIDLTSRYHIYCIESAPNGTVQMLLAGSDWSPYGFRYAASGNADAFETLSYYAHHGGMENTDTKMDYISGRWFYFEAKR